ncbi:hypothetical protein F5Y06DRAFT_258190 [Hypoxylon sp. FL0890]|nr:hypothetical protein F5Y06DRAFT_258190 [Hypoxylon sp. FL0890]
MGFLFGNHGGQKNGDHQHNSKGGAPGISIPAIVSTILGGDPSNGKKGKGNPTSESDPAPPQTDPTGPSAPTETDTNENPNPGPTATDTDSGPEPTETEKGGGGGNVLPTTVAPLVSVTAGPSESESESETSSEETSAEESETSIITPAETSTSPQTATATDAPTSTPTLSSVSTPVPTLTSTPMTTTMAIPMTMSTFSSLSSYTSSPTSSAQTSSGSVTGSGSGGGGGGGTENGNTSSNSSSTTKAQTVPTWAIPLMVIGIAMGLTFLASLAFFCIKERRKKDDEAQTGQKPNYARAVGKALTAATLLFIPIWIAKRLREWNRKREEEREERVRKFHEEVVAYAKLGDDQEHEHEQEQEQQRELGGVLGQEQEDRRLEEGVVVMDREILPVPATTLAPPPPSPVGRSPSMVSSLSSRSQGSQGQYERLENIVPSPVSEEAPYAWKPPPPSGPQVGSPEDSGSATGTDMGARRKSDIPSVLRPGGGG